MVATGGHHQQHVPPLQLNGLQGVKRAFPTSPRAVPACTATW